MEVEHLEIVGEGVRCIAVSPHAPGLVVTAVVGRSGSRLIVTQLSVAQDHHTSFGEASEVTNDAHRVFAPTAVIQALIKYLADHPSQELRQWFKVGGSRRGLAAVADVERARELTVGTEHPRGPGRPRKYSHEEMVHWATVCLRLDATHPSSLHEAVAQEMSKHERLARSTRGNARDLLKTLRKHGFLEPARKGGAKDPLNPGPNYPLGVAPDEHP